MTGTTIYLPDEILDDVLGYVTKRDLKNLRRAGRCHLADLASSKLFITAYVAARRGILDALGGLANHSVLRHHVKIIVLDGSYLDPQLHGELSGLDWSNCIETVYENKHLARDFAEQEYIQTYDLRAALDHAVEAFVNVEKIVYADMPRHVCLPVDAFSAKTSLMYCDPLLMETPLAGKYRKRVSPCCLAEECGRKHLSFYRRQFGSLTTLLQVVNEYNLGSLGELSLGSNFTAPYTAGIPDFFFDRGASTFRPLFNIIKRLRKLNLTVSFPSLQQTTGDANAGQSTASLGSTYKGLRHILDFATELEELCLSGEPNVASLSLEHLLPHQALGSLRVLHLLSTEASYATLSTLIWCNRHTLRRVHLDDFNLLTKGWPYVSNFTQKHTPGLTVVYGFTWYQGLPRPITWSPNTETTSNDNEEVYLEEDDPEDGSYSDGEDFVATRTVVGYQQKTRASGSQQMDDSEYEDLIKMGKYLKKVSDSESLEYDSDDQVSCSE